MKKVYGMLKGLEDASTELKNLLYDGDVSKKEDVIIYRCISNAIGTVEEGLFCDDDIQTYGYSINISYFKEILDHVSNRMNRYPFSDSDNVIPAISKCLSLLYRMELHLDSITDQLEALNSVWKLYNDIVSLLKTDALRILLNKEVEVCEEEEDKRDSVMIGYVHEYLVSLGRTIRTISTYGKDVVVPDFANDKLVDTTRLLFYKEKLEQLKSKVEKLKYLLEV